MPRWTRILLFSCLLCLIVGAVIYKQVHKDVKEEKGKEVMINEIYIDPAIDMKSEKDVIIIIHFKTKPAKAALALAKMTGVPLTLEQAEKDVEDSHARFQKDVERYLGQAQIPYRIVHTYKSALNGAALKLPANKIHRLLQSDEIEAIFANKEYQLNPPPKAR